MAAHELARCRGALSLIVSYSTELESFGIVLILPYYNRQCGIGGRGEVQQNPCRQLNSIADVPP